MCGARVRGAASALPPAAFSRARVASSREATRLSRAMIEYTGMPVSSAAGAHAKSNVPDGPFSGTWEWRPRETGAAVRATRARQRRTRRAAGTPMCAGDAGRFDEMRWCGLEIGEREFVCQGLDRCR